VKSVGGRCGEPTVVTSRVPRVVSTIGTASELTGVVGPRLA
jgi:hypothetical protein